MTKNKPEISQLKFGLKYPDGSGNRIDLSIDLEDKNAQWNCKIDGDKVMCNIEELVWLRDAINEALKIMEACGWD